MSQLHASCPRAAKASRTIPENSQAIKTLIPPPPFGARGERKSAEARCRTHCQRRVLLRIYLRRFDPRVTEHDLRGFDAKFLAQHRRRRMPDLIHAELRHARQT